MARDIEVRRGDTFLAAGWRVVELWTLSAEELLRTREPALMPWVPLANFTGEPEPLLRQCRQVIDERANPGEVSNLLAVSQVFAGLAVADFDLIHRIFGELTMVVDSPILQEMTRFVNNRRMHRAIIRVLERRFGSVPEDLRSRITAVLGDDRLDEVNILAGTCADLSAFERGLASLSSPPTESAPG